MKRKSARGLLIYKNNEASGLFFIFSDIGDFLGLKMLARGRLCGLQQVLPPVAQRCLSTSSTMRTMSDEYPENGLPGGIAELKWNFTTVNVKNKRYDRITVLVG